MSSGNTGALMAMAKLSLRTMPGIDRPALAALLPTLGDNDVVMLDLGANTECDARNLVQFAVMGAAPRAPRFDLASPRVVLLNIGSEDQKGTGEIRQAAQQLREATDPPMTFTGFVEGDRLSRGHHDVIVTDGFSATSRSRPRRGRTRSAADLLRLCLLELGALKIGFLISRPATELLRDHLDPNNHNRGLPRPQRAGAEEPDGGATKGVPTAIGNAIKHGARRSGAAHRRGSRQFRIRGRQHDPGGGDGHGSALPARRVSNAELAEQVDHRRVDRRAHRHPLPPHRRPGRDDRHAGRRRLPGR
ncbi:hypothetical protein AB5I41_21970 [Sphingomonas sp. MMS24-JH45]